jgi:hypothetical protein
MTNSKKIIEVPGPLNKIETFFCTASIPAPFLLNTRSIKTGLKQPPRPGTAGESRLKYQVH